MMARLASYIAEQVMGSLKRLICAFRGHEEYLHFEKNRVYLECVACGHESPGWTIDSTAAGAATPIQADEDVSAHTDSKSRLTAVI